MRRTRLWPTMGATLPLLLMSPAFADDPRRITNLFDAFGAATALQRDWGFAALIEYGGKRILFDTGNNAGIFQRNVELLNIDLARLDAVIISHRHGDHTSGLSHVLQVNPDVTIYTPLEGGYFKSSIPREFLARQPGLPPHLRYYGGEQPARFESGTPWAQAHFTGVAHTTEIFPGVYVLTTRSQKSGTLEMNELSLALRTPKGLAVVVGCSHPGVDNILAAAARIDSHVYLVMGGFHLVLEPEAEVERVALMLRDELRVDRVAPAHCTSERGFAVFQKHFQDRFHEAGLGAVIPLP